MDIIKTLQTYWPYVLPLIGLSVLTATALHILLKKRDTRAATGWLGLVWFAPLIGVCLYWLFGVNRIRRHARTLFSEKEIFQLPENQKAVTRFVDEQLEGSQANLSMLFRLTENVTRRPMMPGNQINPLENGDEAYPLMLSAIRRANTSITFCSYIFDRDSWGDKFQRALIEAKGRDVETRVLIDGVGARYSFPPITWKLRRNGIPTACFMQSLIPWRFRYLNLRNHRKILVVDGNIGFTGGMNIREGCFLSENPSHPIQDLHFHVKGPVVAQLQSAFAEDWVFTTGERLNDEKWFPELFPVGDGSARGITDGPDEDFDKLRMTILGAVTCARKSIKIVTPYFLPDNELVSGLCVAALRGVDVEIMLPVKSNLRMVKWASDAGLEELIAAGCNIFYTKAPFDHSKVMLVDNLWTLIGSANWDSRSMALNFEFNLECYDSELAEKIGKIVAEKKCRSVALTGGGLAAQKTFVRLRNNFFRLFSPYL